MRLQITNISKITRNFIIKLTLTALLKPNAHKTLLNWWRWADSNRWPSACKADALPTELHPLHKRSTSRPCHLMVGLSRLERLTSPLSAGRSTTWAIGPENKQIIESLITHLNFISLERRWSSRRFSYSYLVTTLPQSSPIPSISASKRLAKIVSGTENFHGMTGSVYKVRERIHRAVLIRDY